MRLGLALSLTGRSAGGGGAPAFSPASLFASGEQGGWYDPSDLSTLWKDTAGTDPITADGDVVARIDDKSGNGNHLTQTTLLNRPTYKTSGGLHWLLFDGANDEMTSAPFAFGGNVASVHAGAMSTGTAFGGPWALNGSGNLSFYSYVPLSGEWRVYHKGTSVAERVGITRTINKRYVITGTSDRGSPAINIRLDGVAATPNTATVESNAYGSSTLSMGGHSGAAFAGRIYGLIVRSAVPDATEVDNVEAYFSEKISPVISIDTDSLDQDPPVVILNVSEAGTITWDFHSTATYPGKGSGDIGTGTYAVTAPQDSETLDLSAYSGSTGFIHFVLTADLRDSNTVVSQQVTVP